MFFQWLRQVFQHRFFTCPQAGETVPTVLVGEWQSENGYRLVIGNDGQGGYEKIDFLSARQKSYPLGHIRIIGSALIVRTLLHQNYFAIDKPPFREGNGVKMVLNGVVFSKIP